MTEDEMVEWHHQLDGHEFEQALGVGDGQGSLSCCMQYMGSQRVGPERKLSTKELMFLNCGVGEDF